MEPRGRWRDLPEVLLGLVALALALAIAVPLTASIVMNGVRDVKRTRDSIVVTGSAKQPIEANLAVWSVSVASHERTPAAAARSLRSKAAAVRTFLARAGLAADVTEPPVDVERVTDQVPTGLKKPRFRSVPAFEVSQAFNVQTKKLDTLQRTAAQVDQLLIRGVDVSVGQSSTCRPTSRPRSSPRSGSQRRTRTIARRRSRKGSADISARCAASTWASTRSHRATRPR